MLRLIHGALSRRSTLHRYSHFCKQGRLPLTKRCLCVNSVAQGLEVGFDGGVQAPGLGLLLAQLATSLSIFRSNGSASSSAARYATSLACPAMNVGTTPAEGSRSTTTAGACRGWCTGWCTRAPALMLGLEPFCDCPANWRKIREPTSGLEPLSCSLRVIDQALQGCAGDCKSRISKPLPLLCFAPHCTVLRSRWCQCGVSVKVGGAALARRG